MKNKARKVDHNGSSFRWVLLGSFHAEEQVSRDAEKERSCRDLEVELSK